ncbi:MAG: hypothetical protein PHI29_13310 [Gallionella sp.]|nr:hypothetical protein [Gallionella sp.]
MDFTAITAAINTTTILAGIAAVAAIKVGPPFARWGYAQVTKMFGK